MTRALLFVAAIAGCTPHQKPEIVSPPQDRTPPPPQAPRDPEPKVDGDVVDAWTHGIHVLVKRIPGADATATGIFIGGGALDWDAKTAGVGQLALAVAANGGTTKLDKDKFSQRLSDLGSTIGGAANEDYSSMTAWSLTRAWDETFTLLVDAFRQPAIPPSEVELQRQLQLAQLKGELDNPDSRLGLVVAQDMFKGHPYSNRAVGSVETVSSLTAAQLGAHLAKLREASRLLVVVVGDVEPGHAIAAVGQALGDLPAGSYKATAMPDVPAVVKGEVTVVADKLPTNYITAVFVGPRWSDPDFIVARVGMAWLAAREFEEVRTKRNLSYAPNAGFNWNRGAPLGYLYVTAVDPRTTMKVMLDEAKKLRDDKMTEHDIVAMKSELLTGALLQTEAPAAQAESLAAAQIRGGDWHFVRAFPDRVKAVTADQVQAWASKHITHLHTFVIGDGQKIDKQALESF